MSINPRVREQIMQALNNLSEMADKVAETPNYRMMMMMRERLSDGIPPHILDQMIGKMSIKVSQDFMDDEELVEATLETYEKLTVAIYEQLKEDTTNPDIIMINMASSMSMEFEV